MLRKIIILFICFTTLLFAMTKDEIKPTMSKNIDLVLALLKNKELNTKQKGEKIISIMNSSFDYSLMSRLALGAKWKQLNSFQKSEFTKVFEKTLKDSYIEKLELYSDEKVRILQLEEPKKNRIILNTEIIGKSENYEIDYKFYQKAKDNWKIYDISLIGVSIIQTYRQQFAGFLKEKSFEELLESLKNKNKIDDKKNI